MSKPTTAPDVAGIQIEKATPARLQALGATAWPTWEKEVSTFDWTYDEPEVCWFLQGDVTVQTAAGEVRFGQGDIVRFPAGLSCTWVVHQPVKKHYKFG